MPATILVVEDDAACRYLVRVILEARGHHVVDADSAETALTMARESLPDLIVLDFKLPGMSGQEVMAILRQDERLRHIPVVGQSGIAAEEALSHGCREYVLKPTIPADLVAAVERHLPPAEGVA